MSARRDLLQGLSLGLASLLLATTNCRADEPAQHLKSRVRFPGKDAATRWMRFPMPDDGYGYDGYGYIVFWVMRNAERMEALRDSGVGSIALNLCLAAKLGLPAKGYFFGNGSKIPLTLADYF